MSPYLCFRKDGVAICTFCRCATIYDCLSDYAPFDEWRKIRREDLIKGRENAEKFIQHYEKQIKKFQTVFNSSSTLKIEERFDLLEAIEELEKNCENYKNTKNEIDLLICIWETCS